MRVVALLVCAAVLAVGCSDGDAEPPESSSIGDATTTIARDPGDDIAGSTATSSIAPEPDPGAQTTMTLDQMNEPRGERRLVHDGELTQYQVDAVSRGEAQALVFDEYVILDKIGEGGMGQVYKARHRRMDRVVALKVLPAAAMKSKEAVSRFEREVKAAARLNHPNIVAAHDADHVIGLTNSPSLILKLMPPTAVTAASPVPYCFIRFCT